MNSLHFQEHTLKLQKLITNMGVVFEMHCTLAFHEVVAVHVPEHLRCS